jgi:hypothetical protein
MSKLANGFFTASLTTAAVTFGVVSGNLPKISKGTPPDTTTNSNVTYMSIGKSQYIKIEDFSIDCAFDPDQYDEFPTWGDDRDVLTAVLEDGTSVAIPVQVNDYEPTGFEVDGFPVATITFSVDTGVNGDTGLTVTPPA